MAPEIVLTGRFGSGKAISFFPGDLRSVLSDGTHLHVLTKYYRLTSGEFEEDFR